MPLILRVDVDNGYLYDKSKMLTLLNYINENYLHIVLPHLGYLKHLAEFLRVLNELGLKASLFFKYITIPHAKLKSVILSNNNLEVGLHLLSAVTYEQFIEEVKKIESAFNRRIHGFTKHGDGDIKLSRRHAWRYEPKKYVEWCAKAGLKYFAGNEHIIPTRCIKIDNSFYFRGVFYIEPFARKMKKTVKDVVDLVDSDEVVVALIHPCNFVRYNIVQKEFYRLISNVEKVYSFIEFLQNVKRVI